MQHKENTPRSSKLLVPCSGSKKQKLAVEINNQGDRLDVRNKIVNEIAFEKAVPQTTDLLY